VRPADERPQQKKAGILRNDPGQKVLTPRGHLLSIQEAANYLELSRASLAGRGWRFKNRITAIKFARSVRFAREALDHWIKRHRKRLPKPSLDVRNPPAPSPWNLSQPC
jgi:excisionase family DNA binding protein